MDGPQQLLRSLHADCLHSLSLLVIKKTDYRRGESLPEALWKVPGGLQGPESSTIPVHNPGQKVAVLGLHGPPAVSTITLNAAKPHHSHALLKLFVQDEPL